jgi:hypothetical protein
MAELGADLVGSPGSFVVRFLGGGSPLGPASWHPERRIHYAIINAVAVDEVGDDPVRWLVLGPDRAGTCSNWW